MVCESCFKILEEFCGPRLVQTLSQLWVRETILQENMCLWVSLCNSQIYKIMIWIEDLKSYYLGGWWNPSCLSKSLQNEMYSHSRPTRNRAHWMNLDDWPTKPRDSPVWVSSGLGLQTHTSVPYIYLFIFNFMSMNILPTCMYVHYIRSVPVKTREGIGSPGIGIINGCGCWNPNPAHMQEQ